MSNCGDFHGQRSAPARHAGVISRIRVENFMCHSSLEIVLGDHVNFITGQNGSGKSAILAALCIAFGCRAKGTQRASTLKDFIKTGSSHSSVQVEISNEGNDAFKPEVFGHLIILERKISEATSSTILKDHQGKKVASRKEDLQELVDHFNIDVESPCVIMSQDKSREFLHSGSDRDKFKFFFKATLLQQVNDLLLDVRARLSRANGLVEQLETTIRPIVEELDGMLVKIKSMEQVQEISEKVHLLKKKLAWAWVYDVDKQLQDHTTKLEKLRGRVPTCQSRIDKHSAKANGLREQLSLRKSQIAQMMEKTSEVRRSKEELEHKFSLATKERLEFLEEHKRKCDAAEKMKERVKILEQQVLDIEEQHLKDTQAEEDEYEEKLKGIQIEYEASNEIHLRFNEEEKELLDDISMRMNKVKEIASAIEALQKKYRDISISINELQQNKRNEVTAFGGERVIHLLRAIERRHHHFKSPPIGPIGAHLTLLHGDIWAFAVEYALGKLLNAFIVTDHKDSLLLRECARESDYNHLQIIIYDFSRPNLDLPNHMLPQTNHPTTLSALHSNNSTVLNVLVDVGSAERQVLVKDYDAGKSVAFDQRIANLKEVFTLEGYKMFSRNSVQTILPPHRKARTRRLSRSFDDQIKNLQRESSDLKEQTEHRKIRKREAEEAIQTIQDKFQSVKKRCTASERDVMAKKFKLEDFKRSHAQEKVVAPEFSVDELRQEVSRIQEDITVKDNQLVQFQARIKEADRRASDLKISLDELRVSAKGDIDAFEAAERELLEIEENLRTAEGEILHYEGVMRNKVIRDIEDAETQHRSFEETRKENCRKASIICPESEVDELGGCHSSTPEHLSAQLNKLQLRFQRESVRYSESIDDLRMLYEKKQRRIIRKQKTYEGFRKKLTAFEKALQLRFIKFERNANSLKKQLTWQFNKHLRKKGVSGLIKVNYEEKTLKIEVKMPHDASKTNVRDTRGLSGGERSFSTLCFALALHEMTESPFRAMDEFDVFMDAVSRKISLDTLVDFASTQGSQWIFITPHDISSVKQGELVKKQQLAAPRA